MTELGVNLLVIKIAVGWAVGVVILWYLRLNIFSVSIVQIPASPLEKTTRKRSSSRSFHGFHDFSQGPRPRFEVGKSLQDFLQNNETYVNEGNTTEFFQDTYYSAAWLTSMRNFLNNTAFQRDKMSFTGTGQLQEIILEDGTWAGVEGQSGFRTWDMFEFYVQHMSWYKWHWGGRDELWPYHLRNLATIESDYEKEGYNNPTGEKNGRVLVIIPYHSSNDTRSKQDEKQLYLNITVKTVARIFPNIVVATCDQSNYYFVAHSSGLNEYLYDVLLVENLATCEQLPRMSTVSARDKIAAGTWNGFEWVYFTEADEIPHMRDVNKILRQTLVTANAVLIPHRSYAVAVPQDFDGIEDKTMTQNLDINANKNIHSMPDLRAKSCCFLPETVKNQTLHFLDPTVHLFRQHKSHTQTAGICHEFIQMCYICRFAESRESCAVDRSLDFPTRLLKSP